MGTAIISAAMLNKTGSNSSNSAYLLESNFLSSQNTSETITGFMGKLVVLDDEVRSVSGGNNCIRNIRRLHKVVIKKHWDTLFITDQIS